MQKNNVKWQEPLQTGVFRGKTDRDTRKERWQAFMHQGVHLIPERIKAPDISTLNEQNLFQQEVRWPTHLDPAQIQHEKLQHVSERMAHRTLHTFLTDRGIDYAGGISSPNTAFTAGSRLSTHLAWGTLSPRVIYQQIRTAIKKRAATEDSKQWKRSLRNFESRLHWRDHFIQRLESEPDMEFVHQWVPELREASILNITMKQLEQYDYPKKRVDFATESAKTREQMYSLLKRYRGNTLTKEVFKVHGSRRKKRQKQVNRS